MIEMVKPIKEVEDVVKGMGGQSFKLCYQCGLCTIAYPWNAELINQGRLKFTGELNKKENIGWFADGLVLS